MCGPGVTCLSGQTTRPILFYARVSMPDQNTETVEPVEPLEVTDSLANSIVDETGAIFPTKDLLSTGSTLLNLLITNRATGGFLKGKYVYLVGDSNSGKTFLSVTCFAEATINKEFANHRLIYDNIEDGMLMDTDRLFSPQVSARMEPPESSPAGPVFSDTIESFYYHLSDALFQAGWDDAKRAPSNVKHPRPFIYVLDSMDSLDTEAGDKKFDQQKKAYQKQQARRRGDGKQKDGEKEEKVAGSYGMDKAKKNSEYLRKAMKGLRRTGSILIVISQTRDNPDGYGKTRAGGRALKFYATTEVWSSVVEDIRKDVNGKDRKIGTKVKLQTRKNRMTGKLGEVEIDIYPDVGFDDIGTCVDFLTEEGWWEQSGNGMIDAKALGLKGTREKIIRHVERKGLEKKLQDECQKCWTDLLKKCAVVRKNKYATP